MKRHRFLILSIIFIVIAGLLCYRVFFKGKMPSDKNTHTDNKVSAIGKVDNIPPSNVINNTADLPPDHPPISKKPIRPDNPPVKATAPELIDKLRKLLADGANRSFGSEASYHDYLNQLKVLGVDAFPYLRDVILNRDETVELRTALIQVVGGMKGDEPIGFLLGIFGSKSNEQILRNYAITSVRKSGDSRIFDTVRVVFDGEQGYPARYNLVQMMGETKDERAIPILTKALESDHDKQVRYLSAMALSNFLDDFSVREKLKYYAVQDGDAIVRRNCVIALGGYKKDEIKDFLEQILKSDSDSRVLRTTRAILKKNFDGGK